MLPTLPTHLSICSTYWTWWLKCPLKDFVRVCNNALLFYFSQILRLLSHFSSSRYHKAVVNENLFCWNHRAELKHGFNSIKASDSHFHLMNWFRCNGYAVTDEALYIEFLLLYPSGGNHSVWSVGSQLLWNHSATFGLRIRWDLNSASVQQRYGCEPVSKRLAI